MFTRMLRYRPLRTDDGAGGWVDTYSNGEELWGGIALHENRTELTFQNGPDVKPEDILVIEDQYYRVIGMVGHIMGPAQKAILEITKKPEVPLT